MASLANGNRSSTQQRSDTLGGEEDALQRFFQIARVYRWDWVTCLLMFSLGGGVQEFVTPARQDFTLLNGTNFDLAYPSVSDQKVPTVLLLPLTLVLPVVLLGFLYLSRRHEERDVHELHHLWLSFLTAGAFEIIFQGLCTVWSGELRPDFLATCKYSSTSGECTTSQSALSDARRSFFSGHASLAMAMYLLVSLHVAGRLRTFADPEGHVPKYAAFFVPPLFAIWIGLTRIVDNRHHPRDVLFGLIVGAVAALVAHRMFFYSLCDEERCGRWKCDRARNAGIMPRCGVSRKPTMEMVTERPTETPVSSA